MTSVAFERGTRTRTVPQLAWAPVLVAMATVAAALTSASPAYGYHRDEMYFRMLPLDWGYVDQPPLTPLLARMFSAIADETWAIHIPATALMALSILVVTLITRELGGGRDAQTLCAWAYGTSLIPLEFARVLLTATVDLVVWPAVLLFIIRATLRNQPRWWLVAGLVTGLSMYNKLLVALLLVGLAAGIALVGPRRLLVSRWVWGSAAIALLVGAPNVIYQATHGWPQITMGQALAEHNASQVRMLLIPVMLVTFGVAMAPVWLVGFREILLSRRWRPIRSVAAAMPVVVVLVFIGGSQVYYPLGLMTAFLAAGCVVVGRWVAEGPARRAWTVIAAVGVNAGISVIIALPVVPLQFLGSTPVPTFNQIAQDQVGWPAYVEQVAGVRDRLSTAERGRTVVIADNYGEAGAIARYGPDFGMHDVYSAQNELYYQSRPPEYADIAVVVGTSPDELRTVFGSCAVVDWLDNGLGVDNQEQGAPISICRDPAGGWSSVWPKLQHYD
ncbi:glycosyltransferase family 39 protein [Solicola gregarius]|uniref:Glycosyltransferase family 39 protein n=1 Tax=Solicola gregarius TaxID=2908642 RepID=A0AA46TKU8_9ACTN|nr:glycosyltransferase family 39 protein [Solicola gregarius]UYM07162.1 glycosyltransferase family 39 protein [Solicola gregarius]